VTNDGKLTIDLIALAQSDDGQAAIVGLADYWIGEGAIYSAEGLLLAAGLEQQAGRFSSLVLMAGQ
jgi:hypothetical protein